MSESTTVNLKCQKPEQIDISGRMSLYIHVAGETHNH